MKQLVMIQGASKGGNKAGVWERTGVAAQQP